MYQIITTVMDAGNYERDCDHSARPPLLSSLTINPIIGFYPRYNTISEIRVIVLNRCVWVWSVCDLRGTVGARLLYMRRIPCVMWKFHSREQVAIDSVRFRL